MSLQMPSRRSGPRHQPVCSIEELNHQSPLEELLLANDSKHQTIHEQDEDELFDFYITPYTERDHKDNNPFKQGRQEDTVLRLSKKEEGSTQLYRRADEELEVDRLKNIIEKKNSVIGQLTEQITTLNQQLATMSRKRGQNGEKGGASMVKRDNNEWVFLQRNNAELFESLRRCQEEKEQLASQLSKLKHKVIPQLELQITLLTTENKQLHHQNTILMKDIKQYIAQGQKEIKYVNKMREIISQKTALKDSTFDVGPRGSKAKRVEDRSIRSEQHLGKYYGAASREQSTRHRQDSFSRKGVGERSYSIDKLHRLII